MSWKKGIYQCFRWKRKAKISKMDARNTMHSIRLIESQNTGNGYTKWNKRREKVAEQLCKEVIAGNFLNPGHTNP